MDWPVRPVCTLPQQPPHQPATAVQTSTPAPPSPPPRVRIATRVLIGTKVRDLKDAEILFHYCLDLSDSQASIP
ncbi:hypothetical protein AAHC03_020703 [Spirometra sp. Aus1]